MLMGNWRYLIWLSRRRIVICATLTTVGAGILPVFGLTGLSGSNLAVFAVLALVASTAHAVFLPRGYLEAPILAIISALAVPAWQIIAPWMSELASTQPDKEIPAVLTLLILGPLAALLIFIGLIWLYVTVADRITRVWTIRWRLDVDLPLAEVRAAIFIPNGGDQEPSIGRFSNHDGTDHVATIPMVTKIIEESAKRQTVAVSIEGQPGPPAVETTHLIDLGDRTRIESEAHLHLSLLSRLSFVMMDGPQDRTLCRIAVHLGTPALPFHEYPDRSLLTFLATVFNPMEPKAQDRP